MYIAAASPHRQHNTAWQHSGLQHHLMVSLSVTRTASDEWNELSDCSRPTGRSRRVDRQQLPQYQPEA